MTRMVALKDQAGRWIWINPDLVESVMAVAEDRAVVHFSSGMDITFYERPHDVVSRLLGHWQSADNPVVTRQYENY